MSRQQATSALSSHAKYLQYRERDPEHETKADRQFFDAEHDVVDRRWVVKDVLDEREQAGDIYYHRIILSPSQEEPVNDWQAWTREVMADLEDHFGQDLNWYAVHHANTDDPHVHVIVQRSHRRNCSLRWDRAHRRGGNEPFIHQKYLFRTNLPFLRKWTRVPDDYEDLYQQMLAEMQQPDFVVSNQTITAWGNKP